MQIAHVLRQRLEKIMHDPIVGVYSQHDQPESIIDRNIGSSCHTETEFAVVDDGDTSTWNAAPKNGCIVIFVPEESVWKQV